MTAKQNERQVTTEAVLKEKKKKTASFRATTHSIFPHNRWGQHRQIHASRLKVSV